jgi:hypothetical protein
MRQSQQIALTRIDRAIQSLYDDRLVHFQEAHRRYNELRDGWLDGALTGDPNAGVPNMKYLGFELMVSAELYAALQRQFSMFAVFMEYPGLAQDRIDLHIDADVCGSSCRGYIELKMYYSIDEKAYDEDFNKLKGMIVSDPDAVAVQIHFEMYQNSNMPNHNLINGYAASLDQTEFWGDVATIGDAQYHFYRFAFGKR